ncbi:thermolysin metallopeptidase-like protein [Diaminobutyricimonas aerilata]|uniref:Neutral metalloproteinase n=1 Tax=Diaminobutyricimonas aerilata TaxID=1162967 RepID=A0A2M9CKJ7_9MICO|nr:M4 family metallopeptidase [Diaminobutyricimonas aerilata]PJJ72416.1 thermolysin metallopeptidase-like protein [Diaminobutyricimonas aerilata]
MPHSIVPPYLLLRLADTDRAGFERAARAARNTLMARGFRDSARLSLSVDADDNLVVELERRTPVRTIGDAEGTEELPGRIVRREGDDPTGDVAVDEAYDGLGATHALFRDAFGRDSIDDAGLPLEATVHFGELYDNAFWDGERMVFGDGDGEVFGRFTASLSVIGHELAHGVTQYAAALEYRGQSGALNESVSDVFGALVEQYARRQGAEEASWLIGEGLFTDAVSGRALRSMAEPGSAYDDDVLGKDPQPGHMRDYIETAEDNGGVHLNSGIPNRAFHLVATTLGGNAWERAGVIWYDTLVGGLAADTDFARFARATLDAADSRFGEGSPESAAVRNAWAAVGVPIG